MNPAFHEARGGILKKSSTMKALSFWQPWAWLIVNGHKDVENRSWKPSEKRIGERFVIHASSHKVTKAEYEEFLQDCKNRKIRNFPKSVDDFDYGAYVGSAVLKGAVRGHKSYWAARGSWHLVLSNVKKMKPKKKKGQRGFFPFR